MKKRKLRGIEALKSRYGLMFISIWIVGFVLFFLLPLCQSFLYSLSDVVFGSNTESTFVGLKHYLSILNEDPDYTKNLQISAASMAYALPLILVVSLVLALILNQRFRGRLFFRALYFLPVIIASGVVMELINGKVSASDQVSATVTQNMFSVSDIMTVLNLPVGIATYVMAVVQDHRYVRVNAIFEKTGFWDYVATLDLKREDFAKAIDMAPQIKPHRHTYLHEEKYRELAKKVLYEDEILKRVFD